MEHKDKKKLRDKKKNCGKIRLFKLFLVISPSHFSKNNN
jgi:hypothetical protein